MKARRRFLALACVFALGSPAQSATSRTYVETPRPASAFVDSVGIDVDLPHLASGDVERAATLLAQLGIRHVRIGILRRDPPYERSVAAFLKRSDSRALGITNCPTPLGQYPAAYTNADDIRSFDAGIDGRLEAYEAMNEADSRSHVDPDWASDLKACMKSVRGALPIPFVGPAIADEVHNASVLGDVSALVDIGNFHRYFAGRNPETRGWGGTFPCGVYGALGWAMCEARIASGSSPLYVTETGYNSDSEVDERTQATYLERTLLVNSNAGIARTYVYTLYSYAHGDGFGGDGLLSADLTPKPAYDALRQLLATLADTKSPNNAHAVSYAIDAPPAIEHELFVKSDGSYILALWNDTESWNPDTHQPIDVGAASVTVHFPHKPAITTTVSDRITFLRF